MPLEHRLLALFLSLSLLLATIQLVRKCKLREEYALLWLFTSVVIFVLSISPEAVKLLGALFEVSYAPTLILVLGLLFALAISLSQSVVITSLADHVRDLAQTISLLDWQMHGLEEKVSQGATGTDNRSEVNPLESIQSPAVLSASADQLSANEEARPRKVLVVGLDGATLDLIEPWPPVISS
ncbi:MAG: DUF2304 domain-containing protein, partial [Chloroflexi bacterium]|nr:DUF2304 domain-containing protein [Chloroflexota bacterium]